MNRRHAIAAAAAFAVALQRSAVLAQTQPRRIGFLYFASRTSALQTGRYAALVDGLRVLGYVDGRDFVIEARYGDGKAAAMSRLARELVAARVEVIVTGGTAAAKAAQGATSTIPIVFASSADPIRDGLVPSLARPGGNVTGVTSSNAETDLKLVELLKSVVPSMTRVAVLVNPCNPGHLSRLDAVEKAAATRGIQVLGLKAETAEELQRALDTAASPPVQGLIVLNDSFFLQNERQIAQLASKHRLPSICALGSFVDAGGLLSYGTNVTENFRRAAAYVDRLLKGARPSDLPVERPLVFDLSINFKTAKALGVAIPKELAFMAAKTVR